MDAWERQPEEPARWFYRFDVYYRPLGPERSLLAAYNAWRSDKGRERPTDSVSDAWRKRAEAWHWRERAEAWDEHERQIRLIQEQAEREEWRKRRRKLLIGFFGKLAEALQRLDTENVTLGQVTNAARMVVQELRAEFDDEPTQRHQFGGEPVTFRVVWEKPSVAESSNNEGDTDSSLSTGTT